MSSQSSSDPKPQCTATAASTGEQCKNRCVEGSRFCASHIEVPDELRCQAQCSTRQGRCTRATTAGSNFCKQHSGDPGQGVAPPSSSSTAKSEKVACGAPTKAGRPCKITAGPSGRCKRHTPSVKAEGEGEGEGAAEGEGDREVLEFEGSTDSEGGEPSGSGEAEEQGEGQAASSKSGKCGAITKAGHPCKRPKGPSGRCKMHTEEQQGGEDSEGSAARKGEGQPEGNGSKPQCGALTKAGNPCKLPPGPCGRCSKHREGPPPAAGGPPKAQDGEGEAEGGAAEGEAEAPSQPGGLCGAPTKSGKPCRRRVKEGSPNGRCSAHQPGDEAQSEEGEADSDK